MGSFWDRFTVTWDYGDTFGITLESLGAFWGFNLQSLWLIGTVVWGHLGTVLESCSRAFLQSSWEQFLGSFLQSCLRPFRCHCGVTLDTFGGQCRYILGPFGGHSLGGGFATFYAVIWESAWDNLGHFWGHLCGHFGHFWGPFWGVIFAVILGAFGV